MSQGKMEDMQDGITRKKRKTHILANSAIDAGLLALQALADAPAPAVKLTARAAITAWLQQIVTEQARGTSLLRIYSDLKKATKLRITYRSFQNYVSQAARDAGLRPMKEAAPAARPRPEREPAPTAIEASPLDGLTASMDAGPAPAPAMTETAGMDGWCDRCATDAERMTRDDGRAWWQCRSCRSLWADDDGKMTHQRLRAKKV